MADKQADVYIVDVGRSMGSRHQGRSQSDLDWAMTWVWDKITTAVATDRKTLLQGVVALKSDTTANEMQQDPAYANIQVVQELQQIFLPQLKSIKNALKPSSTAKGDAISALVVAMQMIAETCRHLKYKKTITLVTDGLGQFDLDELDQITKKIQEDGIRVVVLGVDFDDADFGFKEEDKPPAKQQNEDALRAFVEDCGGVVGTMAQAVSELGDPRPKETRPVPSYRGLLTLGNPKEPSETVLVIDVERYPRTMVRRPPTASSFVQRPDAPANGGTASTDTAMGGTEETGDVLLNVRNTIKYLISEKDEQGSHVEVERDLLDRGYEYGRTAVHISESDEGVTKLEMPQGFEIIGFIPTTKFDRFMEMSTSSVVIASRSSSRSIMAMSSFVHALHELESYAVARLVQKDGKDPIIEILAPHITPDIECLFDVHLPFAEDVRLYRFPPLDKVVTVSGKELKEHRHLPNAKLQSAMDAYVDSLDLSAVDRDDEGEATEFGRMDDTFSPVLHRIEQAVRFRAVHPDEPIPPPYGKLTRYREQPNELQDSTKDQLKALIAAADVKKVPPKAAGRRKREAVKPLSGLDVDALLGGSQKRAKVDPANAVPTFKQMLANPSDPQVLLEAATQMGEIIETRIKESYGEATYDQVVEELTTMRSELQELWEPGPWNTFIKELKKKLLGGQLGVGRDEMWWRIRRARLGLLEGKIPNDGIVTAEEASDFLSNKTMAMR